MIGIDPATSIRKGSRLRCIKKMGPRGEERFLTAGNEYTVVGDSYWSYDGHHLVHVTNDYGVDYHYSVRHFEVIERVLS